MNGLKDFLTNILISVSKKTPSQEYRTGTWSQEEKEALSQCEELMSFVNSHTAPSFQACKNAMIEFPTSPQDAPMKRQTRSCKRQQTSNCESESDKWTGEQILLVFSYLCLITVVDWDKYLNKHGGVELLTLL